MGDRENAVVLGGSFAGLMSARVLSDYFGQVTVVDRDPRPEGPGPRKGVPQSWHLHVLLDKGRSFLEQRFPGFFREIVARGGLVIDSGQDLAWYHYGVWKRRPWLNFPVNLQTRSLLEFHTRERLGQLRNVVFLYTTEAKGIVGSLKERRIDGVRIRSEESGKETLLKADLVVDAMGRGSKASRWIEALGYDRVPAERVYINIGYSSKIVRMPDDFEADWSCMAIFPNAPRGKRIGYMYSIEGDEKGPRFICTLAGIHGDHPPTDHSGFREYARSLARPDLFEAMRSAEPITEIAHMKFPENRLFHYEKVKRLPENFAAVGDAVCAFNPIFAQGISASAIGAETLEDELRKGIRDLSDRYFRELAYRLTDPWLATTAEDFRYPETIGRRKLGLRALQLYMRSLNELAGIDDQVTGAFMDTIHFRKRPTSLFRPSILSKVLLHSCGLPRIDDRLDAQQCPQLEPGAGSMARRLADRRAGRP